LSRAIPTIRAERCAERWSRSRCARDSRG
jgi:hypothetical protein